MKEDDEAKRHQVLEEEIKILQQTIQIQNQIIGRMVDFYILNKNTSFPDISA